MRTLLHYTFLIFLFCWGCSPNTNYQIEGTVKDNSLDGHFIYLQAIEGNNLVTLDSVRIKNARFVFKGIQERPEIRELTFQQEGEGKLSPLVFVLQSGYMQAVIDTVSYISGTEQNDRLHDYFRQKYYYNERMNDLLSQYKFISQSPGLNDSVQTAFQDWYDSIREEINQISYDFILVNSNTVAGGLVFLQSYPDLTANQIETILHVAGPDFRTIHGVDIVEEHMRREKKVAIGSPYVDFLMTDADGQAVSLSSLLNHDKWVLLDFWASWCLPCEEQNPFLKTVYEEYGKDKLEIIGISLDYNRQEWLEAIERLQLPWRQLSDLKGWDCEAALIYGIQTLPYTILISPQGDIAAKGVRPDMLDEKIHQLLGAPRARVSHAE
ncbi:MAG: redoxin domain-containing protein [Bacteroidales bacterium]